MLSASTGLAVMLLSDQGQWSVLNHYFELVSSAYVRAVHRCYLLALPGVQKLHPSFSAWCSIRYSNQWLDVTQNIARLGSQQKAHWAKQLRTETKWTNQQQHLHQRLATRTKHKLLVLPATGLVQDKVLALLADQT
jgi:hypothetical protein